MAQKRECERWEARRRNQTSFRDVSPVTYLNESCYTCKLVCRGRARASGCICAACVCVCVCVQAQTAMLDACTHALTTLVAQKLGAGNR